MSSFNDSEILHTSFLIVLKMYQKICRLCILCLFVCSVLKGQNHTARSHLIEEHIKLGKEFYEEGDFSNALMEFNLAIGYLKTNSSYELKSEINGLIADTKEKIRVSKKRVRDLSNSKNGDALFPAEEEPRHFVVSDIGGKALARNIWTKKQYLQVGDYLGSGRLVAVLPNGAIEIQENDQKRFVLRSSENAAFTLEDENRINFHSGRFCFSTSQKVNDFVFSSSKISLKVTSELPFVILIEVLSSGNLLIFDILGTIKLSYLSHEILLKPGELSSVGGEAMPEIKEFELSSNLVKDRVLCGLRAEPFFYTSFIKQASLQAKYLRRR